MDPMKQQNHHNSADLMHRCLLPSGILLLYLVLLLDTGGIYAGSTLLVLIAALVGLLIPVRRGRLRLPDRCSAGLSGLILLSALTSVLFGIDRGWSLFGLLRLAAILLMALLLRQIPLSWHNNIPHALPCLGGTLVLAGCAGYAGVPFLSGWISQTRRLAGPFEYPNTMALFLLVCLAIHLSDPYTLASEVKIGTMGPMAHHLSTDCCIRSNQLITLRFAPVVAEQAPPGPGNGEFTFVNSPRGASAGANASEGKIGMTGAVLIRCASKVVISILLIVGILLTGCRSIFALLIVYLVYKFFTALRRGPGSDRRIAIMAVVGLAVLAAVILSAGAAGLLPGVNRLLGISWNESTLQGRLLYWEDAIRMLLRFPSGIGYMGYLYLQQAMQTGMYDVRFVHNELLQWMLDYGILAGIAAAAAVVRALCSRSLAVWKKEALSLILAGSLFDFHLQYWSMLLLMLALMQEDRVEGSDGADPSGEDSTVAEVEPSSQERNRFKESFEENYKGSGETASRQSGQKRPSENSDLNPDRHNLWNVNRERLQYNASNECLRRTFGQPEAGVSRRRQTMAISVGLCAALTLTSCAGAAGYYERKGDYAAASAWNPLSTDLLVERMLHSETLAEAEPVAEQILSRNAYVYAAYKIRANAAAQRGEVSVYIEREKEALSLRRYDMDEYEDYIDVLYSFYLNAEGAGDLETARQCARALLEIPDLLTWVKQETSLRAYLIDDLPDLILKETYQNLLEEVSERGY